MLFSYVINSKVVYCQEKGNRSNLVPPQARGELEGMIGVW